MAGWPTALAAVARRCGQARVYNASVPERGGDGARGLVDQQVVVPVAQPRRVAWRPPQRVPEAVEYPSSDGRPVAENQRQRRALDAILPALEHHFAWREDVLVGGDLLIYYEKGNPDVRVAPDVFVALGVRREPPRDSYLVWKEGRVPQFVLEVASRSTADNDRTHKRELYQWLQVEEYWLYDPSGGLHEVRLQGLRLQGERYEEIAAESGGAGEVRLRSAVLGLEMVFDGERLRLWDPGAKQYLESLPEAVARGDRATARAEEERARAEKERARAEKERARAEEADVRAEKERARAEEADVRAEEADARAEEADARAEKERRLREGLEAKLRALEARPERRPEASNLET